MKQKQAKHIISEPNKPEITSTGKKAWRIVKRIFGFILPFIILFSIPVIFFRILYIYPYESKPDNRQEYLEENWERYITRRARWIDPYDIEDFELTLCPFRDNEGWDEDISPEEAGFICGFVTVPLFHDQPAGDTIQIPIAIWPDYENPSYLKPLFITHGGPGGSALVNYPRMFYPDRIGNQRDIIIIDQRGTRYAEPSQVCPEVTESSEEGLDDYQDYLRYCRARLTGKGVDLAAFTTPEIARDFEVVRQVLDYSEYNFYGVSYGSHVGQYLAAYYPDRIRSLILDGVAPIPLDYLNRSVSTHSRILNEFFVNCEQDSFCSEQYPDLPGKLNKTIELLNQNPKIVRIHIPNSLYSFGDEINGESFYHYILSSSYLDNNYAAVPYIIQQSEKNHFDSMISFFESYITHFLSTSGGYHSVICAEHSPLADTSSDDLILSPSMMGWEIENQSENRKECMNWIVPRSPDVLDAMPNSNIPTLLLSGFFDPVTPPEYGEIALQSFNQGQHLIDPVGSHGVAFNDDCTRGIVEEFLDDPSVPVNAGCLGDSNRQISPVPRSAISIPFLSRYKDIADSYIFIPVMVLLLMILRSILRGIRRVWKKFRGTWIIRPPIEWKLYRRFELASWTFILSSLGLGIGFDHFGSQFSQFPGYWNASALPGEARWVLLIPISLVLVLPAVVIPAFKLWKYNKSVFRRTYYLFQALVCMGMAAFMIYSDMLFIWVR